MPMFDFMYDPSLVLSRYRYAGPVFAITAFISMSHAHSPRIVTTMIVPAVTWAVLPVVLGMAA